MNISYKESYFEPEQPVSVDRFKGRENVIHEIIKYFPSIQSGNPQHFFISGYKGMGKSSLAHMIANIAETDYSMVTAHILNDGVHTIDELIIQIIERILNAIKSEKWADNIFNFFEDRIESVGLGGLNIKFKPHDDELKNIKDNFAFYLSDLISNFKDKDGIFIIIDDINGLTQTPDFANWYKSFADTLFTSVDNAPIAIMLTGFPEKLMKLHKHNSSVNRIFHTHELGSLNDNEIENFYENIFSMSNMNINTNALDVMIKYSFGMPAMMQEIGNTIFWQKNDEYINENDAYNGIYNTCKRVKEKYLNPIIDEYNKDYDVLIKKIGGVVSPSLHSTFLKEDMINTIDEDMIPLFEEFFSNALESNVIKSAVFKKNRYQFTNQLYSIFFHINAYENSIKDVCR